MTFREWVHSYGVSKLARDMCVSRWTVTKWCNGVEPARRRWPTLHKLSGGRFFMTQQQLDALQEVGKG